MVPSSKWFPQSLGARADWFDNFTVQFAIVAAALGFLPAEVTAVQADNNLMKFLVTANDQMNTVIDAARAFRKVITEGVLGTPTPNWPAQFAGSPADPPPATGVFERLDNLVKRIRLAPGYTEETGQLLGIVPQPTPEVDPEGMKPDPSLRVEPGNIVLVDYVRGKADGIEIQYMLDNSGTWVNGGRFTKPTATLQIPESPGNLPRFVQVRARYVIGDVAVGQYSDIDSISTTP